MPNVSYVVRLVGVQYLEDNTEAHYTLNTIHCIVYSNTTEQQQGVSSWQRHLAQCASVSHHYTGYTPHSAVHTTQYTKQLGDMTQMWATLHTGEKHTIVACMLKKVWFWASSVGPKA